MRPECSVLLIQGARVLLGRKDRTKKLLLPSESVGPLESPEDVAARLIRQLTQRDCSPDAWRTGNVVMYRPSKQPLIRFVFMTSDFIMLGEPGWLSGFKPAWVNLRQLSFDDLATGDSLWMPFALKGLEFQIEIWLDRDGQVFNHRMKSGRPD